jgi:DNA-directed RNA polymerase specialized sigma24 family protein
VIARREALRVIASSRAIAPVLTSVEEVSDEEMESAVSRVDVSRAMARCLTAVEQQAVVLRYWGGRTDREVAVALEAPVGTIKIRIHRAHRKLARQLN